MSLDYDDDDYDYAISKNEDLISKLEYVRYYGNDDDDDYNSAISKNEDLINKLECARSDFAYIGTNKAKRRLNTLSKTNQVAKAIRLALEIEDKNIQAKKTYGKYRRRTYEQKQQLIDQLCTIFREKNWTYGVQFSAGRETNAIIYFEIPGCNQISWHTNILDKSKYPEYDKPWDEQINSTISKLEDLVIQLFLTNNLYKKSDNVHEIINK